MPHSNHDANAGGEFAPSRPRDEPLTTKGHQTGAQIGNDTAPEFHAEALPAGTAPKSNTFEPNPESEVPSQADNTEAMESSDGREPTLADPLDMPGATSGDVHSSLGSGISSSSHANSSKGQGGVIEGEGGMEDSGEAKRLASDKTGEEEGPISGHNVSREGAEDMDPVKDEELAAEEPGAK